MLKLSRIKHIFNENLSNECEVLSNLNIEIKLNQFVVILGKSGSGKTTLLNIMGGLLKPTKGNVFFDEKDIFKFNNKEISLYRQREIGFVFQNFFLEENFSAIDNVKIPLFLNQKLSKNEINKKAYELLDEVQLKEKSKNKPNELSGGECQRVAIARALANNPTFILADEPTGNLDEITGKKIINLLRSKVNAKRTVILVTHDKDNIRKDDIVYRLDKGILIKEQ